VDVPDQKPSLVRVAIYLEGAPGVRLIALGGTACTVELGRPDSAWLKLPRGTYQVIVLRGVGHWPTVEAVFEATVE
jgi:hypothetical protein